MTTSQRLLLGSSIAIVVVMAAALQLQPASAAVPRPRPRVTAPSAGGGHTRVGDWQRQACGPSDLVTEWGAAVNPGNISVEYPRPQLTRSAKSWMHLNGLWQWEPTTAEGVYEPPVGRDLNGTILVPFPVESCLSGVAENHMYLWYRLVLPRPFSGQPGRVLLHFGAVDWQTTVFINGVAVASHTGGYEAFSADLTDHLQDSMNELLVYVYDPSDAGFQPNGKQRISAISSPGGDTYSPSSGIWQTVWLELVPQSFISDLTIRTNTSDVQVTVNSAASTLPVTVTVLVHGSAIATAHGNVGQTLTISVPDAQLWSPQSPFLYNMTVALGDVDNVSSYFGLRSLALADQEWPGIPGVPPQTGTDRPGSDMPGFPVKLVVRRPHLNGKPVFMAGWLDQGFWPDGLYAAPSEAALLYDLTSVHRFGLNMVRVHQKARTARFYYHADKMGILILQDMIQKYGGATHATVSPFLAELKALLTGPVANHPCVVQWELFNEHDCVAQFDPAAVLAMARELDPVRLMDTDSGGPANDLYIGDVNDVHTYPYPGNPLPSSSQYAMVGEYGGLGWFVDGHQWDQGKCYAYLPLTSATAVADLYINMTRTFVQRVEDLSAAVYTQIVDVELECDGMMNYDRSAKFTDEQVDAIAAANRAMATATPAT